MKIPFNKPFLAGKETDYIRDAVYSGKISGDGVYTKRCHALLQERYGFKKILLTTSCTDALEMCAILSNIKPGDEVIAPSYTFVSTVNAFVLRGAKIVFADSHSYHPNINEDEVEKLVTKKTKVIVPVHYAGVACDMDVILELAKRKKLTVAEDAAQSIDSFYKGRPLGSLSDFAAFSFHETKNIISGEGGMIAVNNPKYIKRAEIIREKGTNRSAFFRGEVNKYGWVDIGSSFLPSEIIAAFLFAQLEQIDLIQSKRKTSWDKYYKELKSLEDSGRIKLPLLPSYATNNAHMFYIICRNLKERSALIEHLKKNEILSVFHYLSLHKSPFYKKHHDGRRMPNSDMFTNCLLRLPLYFELSNQEQEKVITCIHDYFKKA